MVDVIVVAVEDEAVVAAAAAEGGAVAEDDQTTTCQDVHHDFQSADEVLQSHLHSCRNATKRKISIMFGHDGHLCLLTASFGSVACVPAPISFAENCSFQRFADSLCVRADILF